MTVSGQRLHVVGGGITGLAAAWEASSHEGVDVVLHEADDRLGGKIRTSSVTLADGSTLTIDEGADAFLARVPDAVELCRELGLDDELTEPAIGRAMVVKDGTLHFLPTGTVLGVPVDLDALGAAGLLSEDALAVVAAELDRDDPALAHDVAIGPYLRERFGRELVDLLVGPLIGGINAGSVEQLSLSAVTPQLAEAAGDGGSMITALRRRQPSGDAGPVFHGLLGGTGRLVDALAARLEERGVELRTGHAVTSLAELGSDPVVITTPAPAAAGLVRPSSPRAAAELDGIEHSSVTLVTLVFDRHDVPGPLDASGVLVPPSEGRFMTAVSWGSSKWRHWDDGRHVVLRASAGRVGDERAAALSDDEIVDGLLGDLADLMGIGATPVGVRVSRWPLGFAQYTVGHLERVDRLEAALADDLPRVKVAGAAYRGLGIPACIRQGRRAAAAALDVRQ